MAATCVAGDEEPAGAKEITLRVEAAHRETALLGPVRRPPAARDLRHFLSGTGGRRRVRPEGFQHDARLLDAPQVIAEVLEPLARQREVGQADLRVLADLDRMQPRRPVGAQMGGCHLIKRRPPAVPTALGQEAGDRLGGRTGVAQRVAEGQGMAAHEAVGNTPFPPVRLAEQIPLVRQQGEEEQRRSAPPFQKSPGAGLRGVCRFQVQGRRVVFE